jgi:hypothetical protein
VLLGSVAVSCTAATAWKQHFDMAYRSVEVLKNTARQGKSEAEQPSKQAKASQAKENQAKASQAKDSLGLFE